MTIDQVVSALGVDLGAAVGVAAEAIAQEVRSAIAPYPPSGPGNQPRSWVSRGQNSWYQRGYGPKWVVKSGAVHGANTSHTLGRVWSVERRGIGAVVGNVAPYAPQVVSSARQKAAFAAIGWTTDKAAVEKVKASGAIGKIVSAALAHALKAKVS